MRKSAMASLIPLGALLAITFTSCQKVVVDCDYTLRTMQQAEQAGPRRDTIGNTGVYVFHADTTVWKILSYEDALAGIATDEGGRTRTADQTGVQTVTGIYNFNFTRTDIMLVAYHTDYPIFAYRNANVVANLFKFNIPVVFQTWRVSDDANPLRYTVRDTGGGWTTVYQGSDREAIDPAPPTGDLVTALPYSVGFEPPIELEPGFSPGTTYSSEVRYHGPEGLQWGMFYATPSTAQAITGEQSLRMQWSPSRKGEWARASTAFTISGLKEVGFSARYYREGDSESRMDVRVLHSTDGGTTWLGEEVFTLSAAMDTYTYRVSETGIEAQVRFSISVPESMPTEVMYVVVDDVVFR